MFKFQIVVDLNKLVEIIEKSTLTLLCSSFRLIKLFNYHIVTLYHKSVEPV